MDQSNMTKRPLDMMVLLEMEMYFDGVLEYIKMIEWDNTLGDLVTPIRNTFNAIHHLKNKRYKKMRDSNIFELEDIVKQIVSFMFRTELIVDYIGADKDEYESDWRDICCLNRVFMKCTLNHFEQVNFPFAILGTLTRKTKLTFPNVKQIEFVNFNSVVSFCNSDFYDLPNLSHYIITHLFHVTYRRGGKNKPFDPPQFEKIISKLVCGKKTTQTIEILCHGIHLEVFLLIDDSKLRKNKLLEFKLIP
jgi:hypothetical protein